MEQNYSDNFLARWLAGELSESELEAFKTSEDYDAYKAIIDTVDSAELPTSNLSRNYEGFQTKIKTQNNSVDNKESSTKRIIPLWVYTVAAACVLLVIGYTSFFQQTEYTTDFAQQQVVMLPDGSEAILNADSQLDFKTFGWKANRELSLEGEAYFKVNKGETFTVNTNKGIITVLGTEFTVISRPKFFGVQCFEGKVRVSTNEEKSVILTQGMAINVQGGTTIQYNFSESEPSWITDESSFTGVDITEVINELERQYNIEVRGKALLKPAQFSGRFTHNNLNQAALTIFTAMDIPYRLSENGIEILKY
ncbi:MAG: FecR family protein [Winogradskyella sp.]|uniref:FecR family protein n=1 Tax=Winogradskyella sp. TaxID=1883156 RepID=UPI000F4048E0|nr:FecR family protein [Winogradskyella sp.]RNC87644.1 MAG: FecR family protein [Winogradskyella sp.]